LLYVVCIRLKTTKLKAMHIYVATAGGG